MPYKDPEEQRARNARYLDAHREENKARCKASYEAHKEERKQKMREYHEKHKEEENAKKREWLKTHPEEAARRHRNYYVNHKEERAAYRDEYARTHVEQLREAAKEYARTHPETIYQIRRRMTDRIRDEVLSHYGLDGKAACVKCGFDANQRSLVIDHINGGGNKHRHSIGRYGYSFYAWLKRNGYPEGFQTLCSNCNNAKIMENNEHRSKNVDNIQKKNKEQDNGKGN